MIEAKHLDKYYFKGKNNELHVLNDISVSLPDTGFVVILGKSGSGKTTLLNTLGGLDCANGSIDYGSALFGKYDMKQMDNFRNKNIGYVFQNYLLLPDELVFENLDTALKIYGIQDSKERKIRIDSSLKAVGMAKYRRKKASSLSGGQQQRVGIARALAKLPKIIIADEPTGNLDSENSIQIMSILKEVSKDRLVLMVTHSEPLAKQFSNRIIRYKDGEIISDEINTPTFDIKSYLESKPKSESKALNLDKLEHSSIENNGIQIDSYSNSKLSPIHLNIKIIDVDGKKYVYIDDESVLINDSSLKIVNSSKDSVLSPSEKIDTSVQFDHSKFQNGELKQIQFLSLLKHSFARFFVKKKFKAKLLNITMFFLGVLFAAMSIASYTTYFNANYSVSQRCVDTTSISVYYKAESTNPTDRHKFTVDDFISAYLDKDNSGVIGYVSMEPISSSNFNMAYTSGKVDTIPTIMSVIGEGIYTPKIVYGEFPNGKYQVVVSKTLIDQALPSFKSLGYSYESLLGRKFYLRNYGNYGVTSTITNVYSESKDITPTIVGISDDNRPMVHIGSDGGYEIFTSFVNATIQRSSVYLVENTQYYSTSEVKYTLPAPSASVSSKINVYVNNAAKLALTPAESASFGEQFYYEDASLYNVVGEFSSEEATPIMVFKDDVDYESFIEKEAQNAFSHLPANAYIPNDIVVNVGHKPEKDGEYLVPSNIYSDPVVQSLGKIVGSYQYSGHGIPTIYTHPATYLRKAFNLAENYVQYGDNITSVEYKNSFVKSIYSSDVDKTLQYLANTPHNYTVMTTSDALSNSNQLALVSAGSIQILLVTLGSLFLLVVMIVLSVRSSLIHHIYDIGVYRSIGATRSYVEKIFLADTISKSTLTSVLGTVLTFLVYFIFAMIFSLVTVPFFVPLLAVIILYGVSLLGAFIPLAILLRHTPYQIVTKYDI